MMDAAAIARLREEAISPIGPVRFPARTILRLLDALEQAQKENVKLGRAVDAALSGEEGDHDAIRIENAELRTQRDAAQQDAKDAHALLKQAEDAIQSGDEKIRLLEEALDDHNQLLRSAFAAAQRDAIQETPGTTNYNLLADAAARILDKHHTITNTARYANRTRIEAMLEKKV